MHYNVLCGVNLDKEEFAAYVVRGASYLRTLFGDLDDLKPCTVEIFDELNWIHGSGLLGLYLPHKRKMDLLYRNDKNDFLNTLVHEMNHQLLNERINEPPRWLDEGLAQYHSIQQGNIIAGAVKLDKLLVISQAVKSHKIIRLEELLNNEDIFSEDLKSLAYAESWSFVHFLLDKRIFTHCIGKYTLSRAFITKSEIENIEQIWFFRLNELFKITYKCLGGLDG